MELYFEGMQSCYDAENVARMFFSPAHRATEHPKHAPEYFTAVLGTRHLLCGVRRDGRCVWKRVKHDNQGTKADVFALCGLIYSFLCEQTGKRPPWGMLTGVRPVRIVHDMRRRGESEEAIERFFCDTYRAQPDKFRIARAIADVQAPIMRLSGPRSYSLYIGIPFCPSRCSYCSFVSKETAKSGKLIAPYLEKLELELEDIAEAARRNRMQLETVYIGGGTPTAISARQLEHLMNKARSCFDWSGVREFTVEAGRPDCTDEEKLAVIKECGATRISINPQTMSDEVLRAIGRKHTAQDIVDCYETARRVGHTCINMDLIAGLPRDTLEGFRSSLSEVIALGPENITVHTLTLKRASTLVTEHAADEYGDVAAMVESCAEPLARAGYNPYYLYRQKGTLQNLENTGFAKPGTEGLYNVFIMEEVHTILSAGAGGSTKLVSPDGSRIERIFNHKYPLEYIERFDEVRRRKKGIDDFYGQYFDLDSEASR